MHEMPKPTDAHKKLARLAGEWTGQETMRPSPWDPNESKATGHSHNRMALDGFALIHDYEQARDGAVTYRGHGVFSYDPDQSRYTLHWFDSMGSGGNFYSGTFEGDVLRMTANAHGGHSRCVFDLSKPNAYRFEMAISQDGQQWMTVMEGSYTKA